MHKSSQRAGVASIIQERQLAHGMRHCSYVGAIEALIRPRQIHVLNGGLLDQVPVCPKDYFLGTYMETSHVRGRDECNGCR